MTSSKFRVLIFVAFPLSLIDFQVLPHDILLRAMKGADDEALPKITHNIMKSLC